MKIARKIASLASAATITIIVALIPVAATAQWANYPTKGIPRLPDGKPNLAAPAPKTADGKPDLSGIWQPNGPKYVQNIAADLKPEDVPFQPWAEALFNERKGGAHSKEESDANCLPPGVPK